MRVEAKQHDWNLAYLTSEFKPAEILALLKNHEELKETDGPNLDKRVKVIRFCIQAGWMAEAKRLAEELGKVLPGEKEKADELLKTILRVETQDQWSDTQRALQTGQMRRASQLFEKVQIDQLEPPARTEFANVKEKYRAKETQLDETIKLLKKLRQTFC